MPFRYVLAVDCENVGSRVSVRYRTEDGRLTDVIGVLETCDEDRFGIRDRRGALHELERSDVVAGKVVPPAREP
jgi:hypothetical protein